MKPAPKKLSASDDLPRISKPANRALAELGVTTVGHLAAYTEADLLALHGFGPKGIQILRDHGIRLPARVRPRR